MPLQLESIQHFLDTWGYLAVFIFVMVESAGVPLPGETMLVTAAIYAGSGHSDIGWVIIAAAGGAIIGDNLGYWIGREGGYRLAHRFGRFIGLDEAKLSRVQHFYERHGDKTVFFGRFVAILRTWAAFLAGINRMPWPIFLLFNAAGGILWATVYGMLGYELATNIPLLHKIVRDLGIGTVIVATAVAIVAVFIWWRLQHMNK